METVLIREKRYPLKKGYLYSLVVNIPENPLKLIVKENPQIWNSKSNLVLESSLFMYMKKKVSIVLHKYGFDSLEIVEILNILCIDQDVYVYTLSTKQRSFIMIYILLKNSNIILFPTIGISYETIRDCYQLLYEKIQGTDKVVIMLEHSNVNNFFHIEKMNQVKINNYSTWIRELEH